MHTFRPVACRSALARALAVSSPAVAVLLAVAAPAAADVRLPAVFGDHMVLQCELGARVWGWAEPGEEVRLSLEGPDGTVEDFGPVLAEGDGRWRVELPGRPAGGPFRVTVAGADRHVLEDVWFGEVWLASGQSNMAWPLLRTDGADEALATADEQPLRLFEVARVAADTPREDAEGTWARSSTDNARGFSAVAYHFGRAVAAATGRRVGLVQVAWGGSTAEAWTPRDALAAEPALAPLLADAAGPEQQRPGVLYDGMLAPLTDLRVRGVIWYQGEANAERAAQYRTLFPALISAWRTAFAEPRLPFLFVQLPGFKQASPDPADSAWAELREAQARALALPATGMAVALDLGEAYDIHPKRKRPVGERLALLARALVYGEDVVASGPRYTSMNVFQGKVELRFEHLGGGLVSLDRHSLRGFQIAGADRVWRWANARIFDDLVVVWRDDLAEPVAVRYAWGDDPAGNLGNAAGLPAAPFRTDDWPGMTGG